MPSCIGRAYTDNQCFRLWKSEIAASTIDDATGEVYDKVARLLGLSYPGGIQLDKLAQNGNREAFKLPEAKVGEDEFSFSGLKTAVLRLTQRFKTSKCPSTISVQVFKKLSLQH